MMKAKRIISLVLAGLFGLAGLCAGAVGIALSLSNIRTGPVLTRQPEAAVEQVKNMLELVCTGDYESAGKLMQGQPSLGADRPAEGEAGALFWDAFTNSLSFELTGECFATDSGVAQNVRLTYLDLDSVTATLGTRSEALLQLRVEQAEREEDISQIYDENGNFREDVVMEVLLEAAQAALREDAVYETVEFTVNLVFYDGQWWIVPEQVLLESISGGILG